MQRKYYQTYCAWWKYDLVTLFKKKNIKKNINIDSFGITHISFTVFDINKVYKILKNEKIKFLSKPVISSDKKVKVVFCKVFDNYFFELVETLK